MPRQFRLSVCPSHACIVSKRLSPSDRPIILVSGHQRSLGKSDGLTPNGGAKYKGVKIFDQYAAISERVLDRGIVTMEDEYKVVCALSNIAIFDDLE